MALNLGKIWATKLYEYNMQASSDRFKHDFIRATNNALNIYSIDLNLSAAIAHISATDDTVAIDADHGFVLEAGIDRYLTQYGHKTGDQDLDTVKAEFASALRRALLDRDQKAAAAATDSEVIASFDED